MCYLPSFVKNYEKKLNGWFWKHYTVYYNDYDDE